jgi:DNA polymerase-3 subunit delta
MARKSSSTGSQFTANMPIVVITGEEPFLLEERTRELLNILREAHNEVERIAFDGNTATLAAVLDEVRSYGLMQQHKLVIVDPIDKFFLEPEDEEQAKLESNRGEVHRQGMERYAAKPVDNATLVFRGPTWRPSKLDKLITQAGGVVIKVEGVGIEDAMSWCVARSRSEYGAKLEADAAELLVHRIGAQLGRLDSELSKLASAAETGRGIDRALVALMTPPSREEKAWEVQSAIVTGSAEAMIAKVNELIDISRQDEVPITWSFNDLLRKIYAASKMLRQGMKDFPITKELKLWGPTSGPILALAKKHEPAAIAQLMRHAIQTDTFNKSGRGDPRRNLETLSVRIADSFAPRGR